MKKIGITGTIASGKTSLSIILKRHGFMVFNSDQYAKMTHRKGNPIHDQIIQHFPNVTMDNGDIDPKKLASVVFQDESSRKLLNAFIHPFVIQGMDTFFMRQLENKAPFAFAEVPLLFEANLADYFDDIILVTTSLDTAISRMVTDRNYTKDEALARYQSQKGNIDLTKCRFIIENDGSLQDLNDKVNAILKTLRNESRQHA